MLLRTSSWVSAVVVSLFVAGCSTDSLNVGATNFERSAVTKDDQAAAARTAAFCRAACDRRARCSTGNVCPGEDGATGPCDDTYRAKCKVDCTKDLGRLGNLTRPGYLETAAQCLDNLACGQGDDGCTNPKTVEPAYPDVAIVRNCLGKREICAVDDPNGQAPFSEDICYSLAALTDEGRAEIDTCFSSVPCASVETCWNGVLRTRS